MVKPNKTSHFESLPVNCIAFSSEEGKMVFTESLNGGFASIFFPLTEHFRTQVEPTFCGLSTLVMLLNALKVDPKKCWRGKWRIYSEEFLNLCPSLQTIKRIGITINQFACIAGKNGLNANLARITKDQTLETFRSSVKEVCKNKEKVMVCSFARKGLKQTGAGHFSPIGAYNSEKDMVLVMDVARYKYPPFWVKLETMYEAMSYIDDVTKLPRGYLILEKKKMELPSTSKPLIKKTTNRVLAKLKKIIQRKKCRCITTPYVGS